MADSGFDTSLYELILHGEKPLLWSVDERLRLIKMRMASWTVTRNRPICRLTLLSGRQLEVASTLDGWTSVSELTAGTRVAGWTRPAPGHGHNSS
jgi:replicative DNA helicase